MSKHLQRDLGRLREEILTLGGLVEGSLDLAIRALVERRPDLASEVKSRDKVIDRREVDLEEECMKVLALHQPVATDLRFIVAVMKVNNDLERVGDLACNIAKRAKRLAQEPPLELPFDVADMVEKVKAMLRSALDCLVELDVKKALQVCEADDEIDRCQRDLFRVLEEQMRQDPSAVSRGIHLLSIGRHLERIGDHATNIAEDVIFMVEGDVVRHRKRSKGAADAETSE